MASAIIVNNAPRRGNKHTAQGIALGEVCQQRYAL